MTNLRRPPPPHRQHRRRLRRRPPERRSVNATSRAPRPRLRQRPCRRGAARAAPLPTSRRAPRARWAAARRRWARGPVPSAPCSTRRRAPAAPRAARGATLARPRWAVSRTQLLCVHCAAGARVNPGNFKRFTCRLPRAGAFSCRDVRMTRAAHFCDCDLCRPDGDVDVFEHRHHQKAQCTMDNGQSNVQWRQCTVRGVRRMCKRIPPVPRFRRHFCASNNG